MITWTTPSDRLTTRVACAHVKSLIMIQLGL